jgi:hypothetical protein
MTIAKMIVPMAGQIINAAVSDISQMLPHAGIAATSVLLDTSENTIAMNSKLPEASRERCRVLDTTVMLTFPCSKPPYSTITQGLTKKVSFRSLLFCRQITLGVEKNTM